MEKEIKQTTMKRKSQKKLVGFARLKSYIGTKKECPESVITKSPITIQ